MLCEVLSSCHKITRLELDEKYVDFLVMIATT